MKGLRYGVKYSVLVIVLVTILSNLNPLGHLNILSSLNPLWHLNKYPRATQQRGIEMSNKIHFQVKVRIFIL